MNISNEELVACCLLGIKVKINFCDNHNNITEFKSSQNLNCNNCKLFKKYPNEKKFKEVK